VDKVEDYEQGKAESPSESCSDDEPDEPGEPTGFNDPVAEEEEEKGEEKKQRRGQKR